MALASSEELAAWLRANPNKRGTADYQTVLRGFQEARLRELDAATAPPPAPQPEGGFFPALRAGATELGGGLSALLGRAGLKDTAQAQAEYEAAQKRSREIFKPTEEGWTEAPWTKFKETLGGSLPYMAAPLAAGAAAATLPVTGPAALATTLGAAGLTSAAQFTGTNLARQLEEEKQRTGAYDLAGTDLQAAALAAIPQAALDTAAMRMIPGIGRIFGQAGVKVTKENAKEIAEQSLKKSLADYAVRTGKAAGIEGITEAAQQTFERLQAGLNIADADARKEYFDSFIAGAVLGGTLSPAGRYIERGREQREAKALLTQQAAEERKAAAAAEEAEKQKPEYLLDLEARYVDAVAQMRQLQEATKTKPGKDAAPDERAEYQQRVEALKTFVNETMRPLTAEYTPRKAEIAKLKERQRIEGLTPQDYMLEQMGIPTAAAEQALPPELAVLETPQTRAPEPPTDVAYAQQQLDLANRQQDLDLYDPKDRAPIQAAYLMKNPSAARTLIKNQTVLPGVGKRENAAILSALKAQLTAYDKQQAAKQAGAPIAQLEAEERAALEDVAQTEAARLAESEARRKLSPELAAMQQMAARRLPESVREEPGVDAILENAIRKAERAAPAPEQYPSAALGQMRQLQLGEDVTATAETAPAPERNLRRIPTEGLTLFGESETAALAAPEKTPDVALLRERIARLLVNPNLSDDAYALLRRAEDVMPNVETALALEYRADARVSPTGRKLPAQRNVAQTEGLLKLLDQQVSRIERGNEGLPTAGRTLQRPVAPVPEGAARAAAASVVSPSVGTKDDIRLARQRKYADLVSQGFTPGAAAKEAFQIGKPTRAAQEGPLERQELPVRPTSPEQAPAVTQKYAAPVTPLQPREGAVPDLAPGPEAERQPGRFLAVPPRKGTLRAKGQPLSLQEEIEPLLRLQERVRDEAAGQQSLFPEEQKKLGAIKPTAESFQRLLARLKGLREASAKAISRAEDQVEPLETEIAQLEEALFEARNKQAALQRAELVLNSNSQLLKELNLQQVEGVYGGAGALKLGQAQLENTLRALNVQRNLFEERIRNLQAERAASAAEVEVKELSKLGEMLNQRASDEARIQQGLVATVQELERLRAVETKTLTEAYPRLDKAVEAARVRMQELHARYGTTSQWLENFTELRGKVKKQLDTAAAWQKRETSNPELVELVNDLGMQLRDIDKRIARTKDLMQKLRTQIDVGVAESEIRQLRADAPQGEVEAVKKKLSSARIKLANLRARLASAETNVSGKAAVARRAEQTANSNKEAEEAAYRLNLEAYQRKLEAMQFRTESGTEVPALSYVQRLARDNPQAKFSVAEKDLIDKDPREVLDGLRSRVTVVERQVKAAVGASRGALFRGEKNIVNTYKRLVDEYAQAQSAEERAVLEPDLAQAVKDYDAALNAVLGQKVVWKGQRRDTAELLSLYEKIAYLENMLNYGLEPSVAKRYAPQTESERAAEQAERERIAESRAEAQEGAGETSGEALTRSQVAKRRKAQKTQYSGKGIGQAGLSEAKAQAFESAQTKLAQGVPREKLTPNEQAALDEAQRLSERIVENTAIRAEAAEKAILRSAFEKKDRKEALTPLEQMLYDEAMRTRKPESEVSLAEGEAETRRTPRRKPAEEEVDEEGRAQLEETFAEQIGLEKPDVELSRGPTANPSTTDSVRTELKKAFPDLGRVQVYDSVDALIAANPQYKGEIPSNARGFVDTAGNKAFLIAENINEGQALSVLLHEVGAHIGLKNMLGEAQYNTLVNAVKSWEKKADGSLESRVAQAARERVEAAETKTSQVNDELLAYAVEEAVNAGVKPTETKGVLGRWLSQVAALMRRALEKFGLPPKALDAQGIVDLAFGAAKMEMQGRGGAAPTGRKELLFTYAGEKSGVAPDALRKAKDMQIKGAEMEKIWNDTNWFQGPDKKWRYEIDDSKAKFNISDLTNKHAPGIGDRYQTTLAALMEHPELYKLYPDIRSIQVTLYNDPNSDTLGSFDRTKKEIDLNVGTSYDPEKVLLHELQHYIQGEEGFTRGGSTTGKYLEGYTKAILNAVRESYVRQAEENPKEAYYRNKVKAIDAGIAAAQAVKSERAAELRAARAKWQKTSRAIAAELETLKNEYESRRDAVFNTRDAYYDASDAHLELLGKKIRPDQNVIDAAKAESDRAYDAFKKAEAVEVPYADYNKRSDALRKQNLDAFRKWLKVRYAGKVDIETAVNNAMQNAMPKGSFFGKFARLTISEQAYQNLLGEVEARDVEERLNLSEKDRRDTRPYSSQPQRREEILFSRNLPTASRVADQIIGKQPTVIDSIKKNLFGLGFRTQAIDSLAPLEQVANTSMDALKGAQMMYYLRAYGMRNNMVAQAVSEGVLQLKQLTRADGEKEWVIEAEKGVNIKQIVQRLAAKDVVKEAGSADAANRLFTLYMAALRGESVGFDKLNFGRAAAQYELKEIERDLASPKLKAEDKPRLLKRKDYLEKSLDSLPTEADIRAAKAEIESSATLKKAFDEARGMYNEYNANLLKFLVDTGAMSADKAKELLRNKDYIPYYRIRGGNAELVIGKETPIRVGNIKDSPHLQELLGGEEPIFNFLDSSVQNTSMLLDMAMRNIAVKNLAYELAAVGLTRSKKPVKAPAGGAPQGAMEFKLDGVDHYVVPDTDYIGVPSDLLVKGMAGIPTMMPVAVRLMGIPARVLRRAVTATPVFAAKQLFRDSLAAFMLSGSNGAPVVGALRQLGKTSPLEARGVTGGQTFSGMPDDISRLLREMQEGRPGWAKAFSKMEALSLEADAATRRSQYESYLKQGLSEMEASLMALESMNFSKRGLSPTMHMATTLIPFFNAQIQGLDVMYKALTGKMPFNEKLDIQRKLLTRGAMMFAGTMAYAAAMQDDEEYKNAPPDVKYGNWFVRLPFLDEMAGEKVTVRVPIPFEVGYIFKALPEMLYNSMQSDQGAKEAFKALNHILLQTIPGGSSMVPIEVGDAKIPVPVPLPAALKPVIEVGLGKSFFTGRDIESAREQQQVPGMRYRTGTSELAKYIGEAVNFSPIKIEALVNGYTGGLGLAMMQAVSIPLPSSDVARPDRRLSELPLVGSVFQPYDASNIIDGVYKDFQKVTQAKDTYDKLIVDGEVSKAQAFLQDNLQKIALASFAGDYRKQMGELTTAERMVRGSTTMSSEDKRKALDGIKQAKIQIATAVRAFLEKNSERTEPQPALQ